MRIKGKTADLVTIKKEKYTTLCIKFTVHKV
jgi:hypothetical protein